MVLRDAGLRVEAAASAEEALDAAALRPPAAAIVELALPDADGVDPSRQLREWSAIPLIVLSAIDEEHHKVRALNAGADDYVTKPFAPRELVARVRAALRRAQGDTRDERIEVEGGLAIDFARRAVYAQLLRRTSRTCAASSRRPTSARCTALVIASRNRSRASR